jgi:uncharacterized membrane protein YhdT
MRNKKLAKYLFSPLLKAMLSNLLLAILAAALWVLLYIYGCSLLSNLPTGSVAVMLYIVVLCFITPILFIILCWQRFVKYQGSKVKTHHYGLFFCTSLFLWALLSIIMGLGPCYRYHIAGTNYFGEALFAIITLPLFLFEAGYRTTSLSFPLLVLFALTIVFSLGLLFGYLKIIVAGKHN